jgi:dTDP-4-dehydrorhamnose reductase
VKIAVLGSSGQLGSDVTRIFTETEKYKVVPLDHSQIEVTNPESLQRALADSCPNIVVNCTAFHRVDECHDMPQKALQVNALGALNVARICAELNALCVYISTDYVFDGEKGTPYTENDSPSPINVYGTSKLTGEYFVQNACPRWLIIRVASLFGRVGARGKGGNFVETILARAQAGEPLRVVNDIRMSPTYTIDTARGMEWLIQQGTTGIFHLTNAGTCTWYEFACKALDLLGLDTLVEPVSLKEYSGKARRPRNSSLRSIRHDVLMKEFLRPWEEALEDFLSQNEKSRYMIVR